MIILSLVSAEFLCFCSRDAYKSRIYSINYLQTSFGSHSLYWMLYKRNNFYFKRITSISSARFRDKRYFNNKRRRTFVVFIALQKYQVFIHKYHSYFLSSFDNLSFRSSEVTPNEKLLTYARTVNIFPITTECY